MPSTVTALRRAELSMGWSATAGAAMARATVVANPPATARRTVECFT